MLPSAWLASKLAEPCDGTGCQSFAIGFRCPQPYLPNDPPLDLIALIHVDKSLSRPLVQVCITPFSTETLNQVQSLADGLESIKRLATDCCIPTLDITSPWELAPVYIAKPWGREVWFTGIEARGQAGVRGVGGVVPLPWVLRLFPQAQNPLILLKILDPLPDEVYGDLYFELHEEKQEVYIVTHVDRSAWPDGVGCIQLGFSSEKQADYSSDIEFKAAYLGAVKRYEKVRRKLDLKLDGFRAVNGIESNDPLPAATVNAWINEVLQTEKNKKLVDEERALRKEMNRFVNHEPLKVGDSIAIPKNVPHALQHGVRVIEFQTPVYERKILSFAQKVLTQDHWDTESGLAIAEMNVCAQAPIKRMETDCFIIELIVDFDDFLVERIALKSGVFESKENSYALIMPLTGNITLEWPGQSRVLAPGDAVLLPDNLTANCMFSATDPCLFLRALPKAHTILL